MSERGFFTVDRGIWDHDLLNEGEPFSRREAWLWLISEAAWKPIRRRIKGRQIDLERGQMVGSTRFIASKWLWSEPRVRRFLDALVTDEMIDANTDAGVSVITICKYDEYQFDGQPSDAMSETDSGAAPTQERRKEEELKKLKNSDVDDDASAREPASRGGVTPEAFDLASSLATAQGFDPDDLRCVGTPYTAQSWLSKGWRADVILHAVKLVMSRRTEPPGALRYFEKAIAQAHADADRPLPTAQPSNINQKEPRNGHGNRNSRRADDSSLAAAMARGFGLGNGQRAGPVREDIPPGRFEFDAKPESGGRGDPS